MGIPLETLSKMFKGMIVIFAAVLTAATAKEAKAFSLFNVVTFQNDACTSTSITTGSGARIGQCFTAEECTAKGGTASGGCAMGFGTCCLFTQSECGVQVDNNCTHIQNVGFPTALTGTAATALPNCNYQINKAQEDVCSLRLDFLTSTLRLVILLLPRLQSWTVLEVAVTHLPSSRIPMEEPPLSFVVQMMDNTCILISDLGQLPQPQLASLSWHLPQQDLGKSK